MMYWARYESNELTSEAKSAIQAMKDAARSTPDDDAEKAIERLHRVGFFACELWREAKTTNYLKLGLRSVRKAAERCVTAIDVPSSVKRGLCMGRQDCRLLYLMSLSMTMGPIRRLWVSLGMKIGRVKLSQKKPRSMRRGQRSWMLRTVVR